MEGEWDHGGGGRRGGVDVTDSAQDIQQEQVQGEDTSTKEDIGSNLPDQHPGRRGGIITRMGVVTRWMNPGGPKGAVRGQGEERREEK